MCFLKSEHKFYSWIHCLLLIRLIICSSKKKCRDLSPILLELNLRFWLPRASTTIQKERTGLYALTVESWVTRWKNVINSMVFHQVTNSRTKNMMAHQVLVVANQFQNHCLTPNTYHNPMANQFQGHCLVPNTDYNHAVTTQAPAFTPDQYQQFLSLIGVHQPSIVQEPHMVNAISLASNAVAGIVSCSPHSVFFAKVMNRKAFGIET